MAISGDTKQNYAELHQSTGETFQSMADRMRDPHVLQGLDEAGRKGNEELAKWLEEQVDDEKAIERHQAPSQDPEQAARDRAAAEPSKASTPAGRSSASGRQQNG